MVMALMDNIRVQYNSMYSHKLPTNFQQLPKSHSGPVYTAKFNQAGQYAMTGSEDRSVCLFNPSKNIMIKCYKNLHNYDVSALAITSDNSKFLTGGSDKNLILTDVAEGKTVLKYNSHNGRINSVGFNMQNNVLVSASYDTTVRCWDNRSNSYKPIDIIKGFKDSVSDVQVRGFEIVCGSMDGSVRFYDIRTGTFVQDEISQAVQSMAIAQSYKAYIASTVDNTISLIQRKSGNKIMCYRGHKVQGFKISCSFNSEDTHILTGSTDGKLYIYDILKNDPIKVINVGNSAVSGLDVHPHGGIILTLHDGNVYFTKS